MLMIANFFKNYIFRKKIHVSFEKENLNLTQYQTNVFRKKIRAKYKKEGLCYKN